MLTQIKYSSSLLLCFCGMNESTHNGTSSTIRIARCESYSMGKCNIVMTFV